MCRGRMQRGRKYTFFHGLKTFFHGLKKKGRQLEQIQGLNNVLWLCPNRKYYIRSQFIMEVGGIIQQKKKKGHTNTNSAFLIKIATANTCTNIFFNVLATLIYHLLSCLFIKSIDKSLVKCKLLKAFLLKNINQISIHFTDIPKHTAL